MKLKQIVKKDKRGILGLDTAKTFILFILVVAVIAFAAIIALATLQDTDVLGDGAIGDNETTAVLQNVSLGISEFFGNATTWFTLLAVVVIILIIGVVIFAVSRFGGGGAGGV